MNYLIFRTDRIGDFLIISPLIKAIKRSDTSSKIFVVSSKMNNNFIKENHLVDVVFVLKSKSFKDRINLFFKLKKYKFDNIIISDKKNRSIFLGLFLNCKNKIFNVSKLKLKKILSFFYKNVFLDNDSLKDISVAQILQENLKCLNFNLKEKDFEFFEVDKFKKNFIHNDLLNVENQNFLLLHYDEKWEIRNYSKSFKKASTFTDIKVDEKRFFDFLLKMHKKTSKKIIITTGSISTDLINKLQKSSNKINESLYEIDLNETKAYLFINENFFSVAHLISKSSLFITCHGAFTHIASNYKVKILDIIEKDKKIHYKRITNHIKNYKVLYRDNFQNLSKEILNNL